MFESGRLAHYAFVSLPIMELIRPSLALHETIAFIVISSGGFVQAMPCQYYMGSICLALFCFIFQFLFFVCVLHCVPAITCALISF